MRKGKLQHFLPVTRSMALIIRYILEMMKYNVIRIKNTKLLLNKVDLAYTRYLEEMYQITSKQGRFSIHKVPRGKKMALIIYKISPLKATNCEYKRPDSK